MSTPRGPAGIPGDGAGAPPSLALDDLSSERCRELLADHDVGRIAWNAAHGPQLYPISYAWNDGMVVFRTSPYGTLSELIRATDVVFEVDDLDVKRRTGWSVIVRGVASGVASPAELTRLWTIDGAVPWSGGIRNVFIGIVPRHITGRSFATVGGR